MTKSVAWYIESMICKYELWDANNLEAIILLKNFSS